jgi:hypothetical protein
MRNNDIESWWSNLKKEIVSIKKEYTAFDAQVSSAFKKAEEDFQDSII